MLECELRVPKLVPEGRLCQRSDLAFAAAGYSTAPGTPARGGVLPDAAVRVPQVEVPDALRGLDGWAAYQSSGTQHAILAAEPLLDAGTAGLCAV